MNYQYGFRTNYSSNICLSFLTDKILIGFYEGLLTGMILIDLQKAFDTIMKFFLKTSKPLAYMVSVISFRMNIFYKYRKPAF